MTILYYGSDDYLENNYYKQKSKHCHKLYVNNLLLKNANEHVIYELSKNENEIIYNLNNI